MQPTLTSSGGVEGVNRPPPYRLNIIQDERPEVAQIKRSNIEHVNQLFAEDKLFFRLSHSHAARPGAVHIIGGGPSVRETISKADGDLCAVNGSHDWLIGQDIVPKYAAFMDWTWTVAERLRPHPEVRYYCASQCHPYLFRKLQPYTLTVWDTVYAMKLQKGRILGIAGGPSMTLRAINLFYVLGYREFDLHGVDSCFGPNEMDYVYKWKPEGVSGQIPLEVEKYGRRFHTRLDWANQAEQFEAVMDGFNKMQADGKMEPVKIRVHGDGLIPHIARMRGIHANSVQ